MSVITQSFVIGWTTFLTLVASTAVALRLAQRKIKGVESVVETFMLGCYLDDLLCLLALVFLYPTSIMIIWAAAVGSLGVHSSPDDAQDWIESVTPAWVNQAKVVWVCLWLQPIVLGCVRLAALFFFRRIFSVRESFNVVSWIMIGAVSIFTVAFSFGLFFDCGSDISANWGSLSTIAASCPFGFLPTVIYTIIDACLDLFVLLLPIPWVFQLQTSTSRKLLVAGSFLVGGIATAAAFVRMAISIETGVPAAALHRERVLGLPAYDILGIVSTEMFWHMVETSLAVIAICLPSIRRFVSGTALGKWIGFSTFVDRLNSMRRSAASRTRETDSDVEIASAQLSSRPSSEKLSFYEFLSRVPEKTTTEIGVEESGRGMMQTRDLGNYEVDTLTCRLGGGRLSGATKSASKGHVCGSRAGLTDRGHEEKTSAVARKLNGLLLASKLACHLQNGTKRS